MEDQASKVSAKVCLTCKKTFSQKSSLVRHLKLCTRIVKPSSLRQKSCQRCASAKAKCDLRRPICSRCSSRGVSCVYASSVESDSGRGDSSPSPPTNQYVSSTGTSVQPGDNNAAIMMGVFCDDLISGTFPIEDIGSGGSFDLISRSFDPSVYNTALTTAPNFPGLDDPWISSLLSPDTTPPLVKHSMGTLLRALRTWPRILSKGFQLPPIFHHSILRQPVPLPLANCCTLVKMWDGQFRGTNALVQDTIMTEIKTLFGNFKTYDETESLAALQAITIYAIMLAFPAKDQKSIPFLDTALFSEIQQVVRHTALSGMVLQEENENIMPSWEAWVHVTSKRRAVLTLYLLHWAYSVYHHVPSFNCDELAYIPAPAPKYLWQATSEGQWEELYVRWLAQWQGRQYLQHEFISVAPGPFLDERTQMWLEDTDEFGILFLSIINATDREAYGFLPRCFNISPGETPKAACDSVQSTH
ncbi:C6 finger domain-containing protein [Leptodontidium sp. MPI-SDFR-AT-0119]|nr:C6 finger domain-containing protein [Leptodontidium sp. MPI-SDFR-AT-0119]